MERNPKHPTARAFSLIELLAILAVVALLAGLVLPVLARAKQSPQAAQCLSNHRQLVLAALMYPDDNGGLWFPNQPTFFVGRDWVSDVMNFGAGQPPNYDITTLTTPGNNFFLKYIQSPRIFHCPGDQSRVPEGPRIRSVSASQAVGTLWGATGCFKAGEPVTGPWLTGANNDCDITWRRYGRASDMVSPLPSRLWVFIDEHANSINDSSFAMQVANTNIGGIWVDVPASYHNGATGMSFADGHVEMHKWVGTAVPNWPLNWTGEDYPPSPTAASLADVQDLRWFQQRTSARAQ